ICINERSYRITFEASRCVSSFFFQAEAGIRNWSVTGVQTCALPIFVRGARAAGRRVPQLRQAGRKGPAGAAPAGAGIPAWCDRRSEERRVGKECRSRWDEGGEKKKIEVRCGDGRRRI